MFDFAWSEIALIAAVALIAIGPKDMPAAIRTVSGMVKKARRMAAEFQTHVDEMVREANLDEFKSQFNDIRNFDVKSVIEKTIDPDGSLKNTFADASFDPVPTPESAPSEAAEPPVALAEAAAPEEPVKPLAPAFIPPSMVPPAPAPAMVADSSEPPAFIPPAFTRRDASG